MDARYRTLLGHFRPEIGHYYFYRLIGPSAEDHRRFTIHLATLTSTIRPRWTASRVRDLHQAGKLSLIHI